MSQGTQCVSCPKQTNLIETSESPGVKNQEPTTNHRETTGVAEWGKKSNRPTTHLANANASLVTRGRFVGLGAERMLDKQN